jgi:hypothetical protein
VDDRNESDPILLEIDRLIRLSRLKEIEFIMSTDTAQRVREVKAALKQLGAGEYLLGTGPSTVGIVPLNVREVVLGRPPTVLEEPSTTLADYCAVDTLYFVPREVSRMHAKVLRQMNGCGAQHILLDLHSTCGTFVNEVLVDPNGGGLVLRHGDIISLGPSQTSTYIYYRATPARPCAAGKTNASAVSWVWLADPQ